MFAQHQPQLSALGRSGPDGFERIATFALATIRQPLRIAVADYPIIRRREHAQSIFGAKHAGLSYLREHAAELYERCEYAYETCDDETAADIIINIIAEVPCLGCAKAGFVTQMIYGLSGCIDTHNLTRFGLDERTFKVNKPLKRFRAVTRDYNAFCRKVGGTAALWDGWCDYLAERDPVNYPTGERVSELHLIPLEC
jgi:hypothetical protein